MPRVPTEPDHTHRPRVDTLSSLALASARAACPSHLLAHPPAQPPSRQQRFVLLFSFVCCKVLPASVATTPRSWSSLGASPADAELQAPLPLAVSSPLGVLV